MIIDFHVHCFPDEIAVKAVPALAQAAGLTPESDGTVAGIRSSMRAAGIDKSVVQSIATKPLQTPKINRWAASVQNNEIISFGTLHPEYEDWEKELSTIHELGLKGIKFHPDYQQFFVDDPEMYAVYEAASQMKLILLFHAGVDIGLPAPYHCTPDRLKRVVRAFPEARIIAAHMGGYDYWDDVEQYLAGEELYFDTSYSLNKMSEGQFMRIVGKHGADRLLFATDSPWANQAEEVTRLVKMDLPDDATEAVLGGNAAKLLGLTC